MKPEKITLRHLAVINQGYQFRKKIDFCLDGHIKVIQMANIKDGIEIRWQDLKSVNNDNFKKENFLRQDDILFCARGHNNYAIHIESKVGNTIAVSQFNIIRVKSNKIDPVYLTCFLNQSTTAGYFKINATTGSVPLVKRAVLEMLQIPLVPLETQKKIAQVYILKKKEMELRKKIIKEREVLINNILQKIIEE